MENSWQESQREQQFQASEADKYEDFISEVVTRSFVFGFDEKRGINSDDLEGLLKEAYDIIDTYLDEGDSVGAKSFYVTEISVADDPTFVVYFGNNSLPEEDAKAVYEFITEEN